MIHINNLNQLRDLVYLNAIQHGWHENDPSDKHYLCLVISEMMEAVQADRKEQTAQSEAFSTHLQTIDKFITDEEQRQEAYKMAFEECIKDSLQDELADTFIRLLDLAGKNQINVEIVPYECLSFKTDNTFTEHVYHIAELLTSAQKQIATKINLSLSYIFYLAEQLNVDIDYYVGLKMKYNQTRTYKHGGKKY